MTRSLFLVFGALLFGLSVSATPVQAEQQGEDATVTCEQVPPNITASRSVRAMVLELAAMSETFREQCATVARAVGVRVRINLVPRPRDAFARASTEMRWYASVLVALVELPVARDSAELLAHEFEHIVEQIAGVCLTSLVRSGGSEATQSGNGAFETRRAVRIGRQVAAEVEAANRLRRLAAAAEVGSSPPPRLVAVAGLSRR